MGSSRRKQGFTAGTTVERNTDEEHRAAIVLPAIIERSIIIVGPTAYPSTCASISLASDEPVGG